jgi:hypothetical protein
VLCGVIADKPFTEDHSFSAIPPASPASFRRQQQLQHMRQQRQQHNMEREERCLAGDAAAAAAGSGGRNRGKGTKAQNAQQQARIKHNQGVKASANVSTQCWWLSVTLCLLANLALASLCVACRDMLFHFGPCRTVPCCAVPCRVVGGLPITCSVISAVASL